MKKLKKLSPKQLKVLSWWHPESKFSDKDAIICDGAIRSGKTFIMFLSFIFWVFYRFREEVFAICGKTIKSINRNLITPMIEYLDKIGFKCKLNEKKSRLIISYKNRRNTFYILGGKDSSSASLIQGMTLAGILFDEVVLMPRSFVEQGLARCSKVGSKYWFNCNPEGPNHWFYREWIRKLDEKNGLYIHFEMEDNPALDDKIKERYKRIYSGSFYKRYIEGLWSQPEGLVYPMFNRNRDIVSQLPSQYERYYVSCDFGVINPTSMGLWGLSDGIWYRVAESYYDSKKTGKMKTNEEYYRDLLRLVSGKEEEIELIIIDPSASSFIQTIVSHGQFEVRPAKNEVLQGILNVSELLTQGKIKISEQCEASLEEFGEYCWDEKTGLPKKENDHAMDDIRYFVNTVVKNEGIEEDDFYFSSINRA